MDILSLIDVCKVVKNSLGLSTLLNNVNLSLKKVDRLALVGPSGAGKTTLARLLAGLSPLTSGKIIYQGQVQQEKTNKEIQLIFQNPFESLTPHMSVGKILFDSFPKKQPKSFFGYLSEKLKINEKILNAYPHQLSGGEAQRVALMRALIQRPKILICDEVLASIDAILQKEILELLLGLQKDSDFSLLWITHDLITAQYFCKQIALLYEGKIVVNLPTYEFIHFPKHPYQKELIAAMSWTLG